MGMRNNKIKKIEFIGLDEYAFEVCPKPFPSSKALPEWWKNAMPYTKSEKNLEGKKIIVNNWESNASFKKCTPMLDILTSGYIVPLWADVQVRNENGFPNLSWRVKRDVFDLHDSQEVEIPEGYQNTQFKFLNQWVPKLPKGYSALIMPCVGYPNSPFRSMFAIVDYDNTTHPLYPPVFLKNNFEGIIEKGTPMFQIIPFKRDNWESSFSFLKNGQAQILLDRDVKATIVNNYVKNFWNRKSYK